MAKQTFPGSKHLPKGLVILYEDKDILVVDKPAGLLTMGTDTDKIRTAYYALTDYVKKGTAKSRNRIFIVHRLDKDTSGILVFAKTEEAKISLQEQWDETDKRYLAIVHGKPKKKSGTITSYLAENVAHVVYSTTDTSQGKLSHTNYDVLKTTKALALLEVELLTGRKNQIRVHLADIGHPIVGDAKYGLKEGSKSRLALHAWTITFNHPYHGRPVSFSAPIPDYFRNLVGNFELDVSTSDQPSKDDSSH